VIAPSSAPDDLLDPLEDIVLAAVACGGGAQSAAARIVNEPQAPNV